jgi:urea transporter
MHSAEDAATRLLAAYGALFLGRGPWVGALVLAATLLDPAAGVCGLAAGVAALATRALLRLVELPGEIEVSNAITVGLALAAFQNFDPRLLALAAFGGALCVPVSTAFAHALAGPHGARALPLLGAPFLFCTWALLFAGKSVGLAARTVFPAWPEALPHAVATVLANIGGLFYVANPVSGVLVLAALLSSSRALALLALAGGLLGEALVRLAGAPVESALPMLAAYEGALAALFLGGVLVVPSRRALLLAATGVVVSSALAAALLAAFWTLGVPPLTAPVVLTVWLLRGALRPEAGAAWARHWLASPAIPEESLVTRKLARARGVDPDCLVLAPPLSGRMDVSQGVDGPYTHRGPWRYALDFLRIENGRSFESEGTALTDFHCFGQPVLAPVWGRIIACRNDVPDNPPGQTNLVDNWGNHVLIALAGGDCVMLAHLRQGSISAVPGQQVAPGAPLAQVGNSGRSTQPHLHLHVQRGHWLGAPTRPFRLGGYLEQGQFCFEGIPGAGARLVLPDPDAGLARGFTLLPGMRWTFASAGADWTLGVEHDLAGGSTLVSEHMARVGVIGDARLFALFQRRGAADPMMDAFCLTFGLTPHVCAAATWRDAPDAALLPLGAWQRLRVLLRQPFGAVINSVYSRRWDDARRLWVQQGEHRVSALGGEIMAVSVGDIADATGPVRFELRVAGCRVVAAALARYGKRGDYGVPDWSVDYAVAPVP